MVNKWAIGGAIVAVMSWSGVSVAEETPSLMHPTIHFQSDSTDVVPDDMPKLAEDVAWMAKFPKAVVILEGHCDHTGLADYNMELGDRRAREIKSHLISRGVNPDRIIMVVSFGAERPVVEGETHAALQQNRRVEVVLR